MFSQPFPSTQLIDSYLSRLKIEKGGQLPLATNNTCSPDLRGVGGARGGGGRGGGRGGGGGGETRGKEGRREASPVDFVALHWPEKIL